MISVAPAVPRAARRLLFSVLLLFVAATGFAQTVPGPDEAAAPVDERLQLAIADEAYPVTPGDVYELSWLLGTELVTTRVVVTSDYRLNLGIMGEVDARGMTLPQLRPEVERIIAEAYPRGLPSMSMVAVGVFRVTLSGAIPRTTRVSAWGLSRLTDVIGGHTGAFTSLRAVEVRSRDGRSRTYDVFRAIHTGDVSQDPLIRPGDTIVFRRRGRAVTVEGEVYEPATFELLRGEGLPQLEEFFQGYLPRADTRRLVVERQEDDTARQISIGSAAQARRFDFQDRDVLIVPSRVVPRPVVYLEGAVDITFRVEPHEDADSDIPVYNRVTVPLTAGDTLYSLIINVQDRISPFADIERGFIIRHTDPAPIRVNMRDVLYRRSEYTSFELEPFDRIVIPLDQPFVVVTGGVGRPGRYPYNPFESFAYYLGLAGVGSDTMAEVAQVVRILDRDGNELPPDSTILPGYTISVPETPDRIIVVEGDVPAPGAYLFEPDRDIAFYTRLAGLGANAFSRVRGEIEVYTPEGDLRPRGTPVEPEDTIFVPPQVPEPETDFVLVTGAVSAPGVFPIVQDATASYYLLQAGGIDRELSDGSYTILSAEGDRRPPDSIIQPGDTVEVARNSFVYNFNRYFPVITTGLGFITTIIAIVNALNP